MKIKNNQQPNHTLLKPQKTRKLLRLSSRRSKYRLNSFQNQTRKLLNPSVKLNLRINL
jgi:hypothetical protein